ncbi:MAG: type II toxin-antitoxin system Phd/YefM family antitoxin [Spirochaetia bacterium]|nr:type II toxin-antitoxin system Phd/YefM family antitoxin [Spirochaetia bacterium]MCF7949337.1 type II toxin-antitoxin system Phd/YefM family antitoxin [Spirochaetia bacterium]
MNTTINITNARKDLYKLVQQVIESHEPVHITGKQGSAVIISEEDWKNIEETLYLASIPGMRESIIEGMKADISECDEELEW